MTVFGWDASDFDWSRGPMDLAAARAAGIDFFTHKATEGTSVRHTHYGEALNRARAAGIPFLGAYHVVRSGPKISDQVSYCLSYADAATPWWRDHPYWFWQVDLEKWPYDTVPAGVGEIFADAIEQRTGRRTIIYASKGQYGNELTGTSHPLWNANYGNNPTMDLRAAYAARGGDTGVGWTTYSGVTPAIWQYGSQVQIGRQSTCDANAFRGTIQDFARLISMEANMELNTPLIAPWQGLNVGNALAIAVETREVIVRDINANGYKGIQPESLAGRVVAIQDALKAMTAGQVDPEAVKAAVREALTDPDVIGPLVKAINDDAARRAAE